MGGTAGKVDPTPPPSASAATGSSSASSPPGHRPTPTGIGTWPGPQRLGGPAPHSDGLYPHLLSDEGAAGVEAAYGDRLKHLTALKDRYDPANLFRMNANIPPTRPP